MTHKFNLKDAGTATVFALGGLVILFLSGYVVITALRSKERRKQVPSYLMFGRTLADTTFAILCYVNIILSEVDKDYISKQSHCDKMSMFLVWCFLVSCFYFGSICFDIYHTITNPFNRPISNSWFVHIICWAASFVFVIIFSIQSKHILAWAYREDYQMCFVKWTKDFNIYNTILLYVPIIGINFLGILVSLWSFGKLKKQILNATYECRWLILRRQFFITLCYTFSYVISFGFWLPVVIPAFFRNSTPKRASYQPYCVLCIICSQLVGDAMAWYYSNYFSNSGTTRSLKILKFFGLLGETVAGVVGIELNASMSEKRARDLKDLQSRSSSRAGASKTSLPTPQTQADELKENLIITEASDEDAVIVDAAAKVVPTQDLSDALRREVVAYMTHGISKSLINTKNETKKHLNRNSMQRNNVEVGSNGQSSVYTGISAVSSVSGVSGISGVGGSSPESDRKDREDEEEFIEPDLSEEIRLYADTLNFEINKDPATGFSIVNQYTTEFSSDEVENKVVGLNLIKTLQHITNDDNNRFVDYSPHMFRYLRTNVYNIKESEYCESIAACYANNDINNHIKSHFSEGASGAFFFFTIDQKYIIKTVTEEEALLLLDILPHYIKYYKSNKDSFLNKFYGLYCLQYYKKIYFVVLNNLLVPNEKPQETYDIKGSWIDRSTKYHVESGKLMKDTDLHKTLSLTYEQATDAYYQLFSDSEFLASVGIMDYSLLLGIYYMKIESRNIRESVMVSSSSDNIINNGNRDNQDVDDAKFEYPEELDLVVQAAARNDNISKKLKRPPSYSYHKGMEKVGHHTGAIMAHKMEGPCVYYFGIIDMLQAWNKTKKWERFFKVYILCKDGKGVSCVEPNFYQSRFMKRMCDLNIRPFDFKLKV